MKQCESTKSACKLEDEGANKFYHFSDGKIFTLCRDCYIDRDKNND